MLVDTSLLREGRGYIDKLIANEKLFPYKGGGIEVNSGDKKKGENSRMNIVATKFRNTLAEVQK